MRPWLVCVFRCCGPDPDPLGEVARDADLSEHLELLEVLPCLTPCDANESFVGGVCVPQLDAP